MIKKLTLSAAMTAALLAVAAFVGLTGGEHAQAGLTTVTLDPPTATNLVGTDHTVTATTENWPTGEIIEFTITDGPNVGATFTCSANADCSTDGNAQVSATYTSDGAAGTDTIQACTTELIPQSLGEFVPICGTATKEWAEPSPTPTVTAEPSPTPTPTEVAAAPEVSGFADLGSDSGGGSDFPWLFPALLLGLAGLTVFTLAMLQRKRPR
jgi:hypothetical protein